MKEATRCLLILVVASCLLIFALVPRYELLDQRAPEHPKVLQHRQILPTDATSDGGNADGGGSTPTSTPQNTPASTPAAATTSKAPVASTPTQQPATTQQTTQQPATTAAPQPSTSQQPQQQQTTAPTSASSAPPNSVTSGSNSVIASTPTTGVGTQTFTQTESSNAPSSVSAAASSSTSATSNSTTLSTGSIIGMSVAGGVAVIGVIAFFIWKFTRKRFSDFDDNEAIKWPELNSHGGESVTGHALPTHATGRAGFGDDNDNASTIHGGYASSLATTSNAELYPGSAPDPYAVPPLPHLNPNQPYHDEPAGYERDPNAFYDPYRGPVPNTFNEADGQVPGYGAEAIPMTQMARTRSPGPQMGYEMGRQSPQPSMTTGRQSPGPQAALGRQSPGPQMAYGGQMMEAPGRGPSPGPHAAYGSGYNDGYGGR